MISLDYLTATLAATPRTRTSPTDVATLVTSVISLASCVLLVLALATAFGTRRAVD